MVEPSLVFSLAIDTLQLPFSSILTPSISTEVTCSEKCMARV